MIESGWATRINDKAMADGCASSRDGHAIFTWKDGGRWSAVPRVRFEDVKDPRREAGSGGKEKEGKGKKSKTEHKPGETSGGQGGKLGGRRGGRGRGEGASLSFRRRRRK